MDVTILQADLFATKGMEYAAVLLYLGLFVGFWRLLRNPEEAGVAAQMRGGRHGDEAGAAMDTQRQRAGPWTRREPAWTRPGAGARGWFTLPEGLLHHQGHTWVRPNGGRAVTVGMNEFARKLVGAPASITLPSVGTRLEQGHHAWELNIDGTVIPMLSPVDGEVLEMNPRALEAPGRPPGGPLRGGLAPQGGSRGKPVTGLPEESPGRISRPGVDVRGGREDPDAALRGARGGHARRGCPR
jgi:hypothetical protein